jgi:F0F1-type ATP synthase assembly protein I
MFWKMIALMLVLWAVGMFASVTLGGLIHLLPLVVIVFVVMRIMAKRPDTEFGLWRPASERHSRR